MSDHKNWLIPYVEGTLDARRTAILEACVATDPALAAEVESLRNMRDSIRRAAQSPIADPDFSIWPRVQAEIRSKGQDRGIAVWMSGIASPRISRLVLAGSGAAALVVLASVLHPFGAAQTGEIRSAAPAPPKLMVAASTPPNAIGSEAEGVSPSDAHDNASSDAGGNALSGVGTPSDRGSDRGAHGDTNGLLSIAPPNVDTVMAPPGASAIRSPRPIPSPSGTVLTNARPTHSLVIPVASRAPAPVWHASSHGPEMMAENYYARHDATDWVVDNPVAMLRRNMGASTGYSDVVDVVSDAVRSPDADARPVEFHNPTGAREVLPVQDYGSKAAPEQRFGHTESILFSESHSAVMAYPWNELSKAQLAADRHDVNSALEIWRDVLLGDLQAPQYSDESVTDQAMDILATIRRTGNLMPFRGFLESQVTPTTDEIPDWRMLGLVYNFSGEYKLANNAWSYVTGTPDAAPEDWYQLGLARIGLGDRVGAAAAFTVAVSELPENSAHRASAQTALATLR